MRTIFKLLGMVTLSVVALNVIPLVSCSQKDFFATLLGDERISIDNKKLVPNQDFVAILSSTASYGVIVIEKISWDDNVLIDQSTYFFDQTTGKLIIDKKNFIDLNKSIKIACHLNFPLVNFDIITTKSIKYEQPQPVHMGGECNLKCWIDPDRVVLGWKHLEIDYFKMSNQLLIQGQHFSFQWDSSTYQGNIKVFPNVINGDLTLKLYATKV